MGKSGRSNVLINMVHNALTQKRLKMYIGMHTMDHNLIIMSLLGGQETRSSQGLEEITAIGEKWS